ncbi:MAG: haloacid dehalogenase, partial [Propionibacteriaceae bacterium]|nr:haloacid dehalogenase [Propionibacteriaceae bacterium]
MDTYLDRRLDEARAFLFDLDGVLTPTAEIHKRAWTRLFTRFLAHHPSARPYTDEDYYRLVDGRRRYDGVRAVLDSRGIHLPPGQATDSGSLTSVCGLGNLKDGLFLDELRARPIDPYPGS